MVEFLTTLEAAQIARRSPSTIRRLLRARKLRGVKVESPDNPVNARSRWLVDHQSLMRYLHQSVALVPSQTSPRAAALLAALGVVPQLQHESYGPERKSG